jgi:hypothetical protein
VVIQTIEIDLDAPKQQQQTPACMFASITLPAVLKIAASAPIAVS